MEVEFGREAQGGWSAVAGRKCGQGTGELTDGDAIYRNQLVVHLAI
jgi:hypothetical protein